MGSIAGHRIDYNGVGVLRNQRHIPSKTWPKYPPPPGEDVQPIHENDEDVSETVVQVSSNDEEDLDLDFIREFAYNYDGEEVEHDCSAFINNLFSIRVYPDAAWLIKSKPEFSSSSDWVTKPAPPSLNHPRHSRALVWYLWLIIKNWTDVNTNLWTFAIAFKIKLQFMDTGESVDTQNTVISIDWFR